MREAESLKIGALQLKDSLIGENVDPWSPVEYIWWGLLSAVSMTYYGGTSTLFPACI